MNDFTSLQDVQFHLMDISVDLIVAWQNTFKHFSNFHIEHGNPLHREASAVVSPANSFGYMDGGFDGRISERFGWALEERVRETYLQRHFGELLIGQAIIVPTMDERIPWLISAPTMRVPMDVSTTANAHLAFRGILCAIFEHNQTHDVSEHITSVLCAGLGTGTGMMPPELCALQMRHAYEVVVHGKRHTRGGLAGAVREHMELVGYEYD